jgi:hypothetical protein
VGSVNWLLMLVTLRAHGGFGKSTISHPPTARVPATMLMTSVFRFTLCGRSGVEPRYGRRGRRVFTLVDAGFFAANSRRWQGDTCRPSRLRSFTASCLSGTSGDRGFRSSQDAVMPVEAFMARSQSGPIPRAWHCGLPHANPAGGAAGHGMARQVQPRESVFVLTTTQSVPWVGYRAAYRDRCPFEGARRPATVSWSPDIPALLRQAHESGCAIDL